MANLININNSDYVTVNHIIFNPTFKCNVGCKSCYLIKFKQSAERQQEYPVEFMQTWLKDALTESTVLCNQVSISVNTNYPGSPGDKRTLDLLKTASEISLKDRDDVELQVTISAEDILEKRYLKAIINAQPDVISLSCDDYKLCGMTKLDGDHGYMTQLIQAIKGKFEHFGVRIPLFNGNFLVQKHTTHHHVDFLLYECGFDHVYLIMEKPPLGQKYYSTEESKEKSMWYQSFDNLYKLAALFRNDKRVTVDGCYTAGLTQKACSEGINLLSVWPNASITGCPYASGADAYPACTSFNLRALIMDFRKLRVKTDWSKCKIPEIKYVKEVRKERNL